MTAFAFGSQTRRERRGVPKVGTKVPMGLL